MANEEQLAILRQGVEAWNKWREENPGVSISLNGADLAGADLAGADLWQIELWGADLRGADLQEADLSNANLKDVNLSNTDLRDVSLSYAIFDRTNLVGTSFDRAFISFTKFTNVDLSKTVGLETVIHFRASSIGIDTIQRSMGNIPEKFLRGCGLSDWEIESTKLYREGLSTKEVDDILYRLHDLRVHQPIQYYSVFISYSTQNQMFVQKLHDSLQNNGVRCWFAPEDVQGGKKLHEQIDSAIRSHDRLLLVLSEHSMNSEWVKTEIANARQKEVKEKRQVLFPISLVEFEKIREWKCFDADTGKDSAREIREYYIPDFSQWEEEGRWRSAFERLLKDLRAVEER